jgi:hypothetical protein
MATFYTSTAWGAFTLGIIVLVIWRGIQGALVAGGLVLVGFARGAFTLSL